MANFLHFIPALPRSSRGASSWGGGEGGDVFVRWGWGCFCEVGLGTFLRDLGGGQCGGDGGGFSSGPWPRAGYYAVCQSSLPAARAGFVVCVDRVLALARHASSRIHTAVTASAS